MRDASTYRTERREEWKAVKANSPVPYPWAHFNTPAPKYQLGTLRAPMVAAHVARSKYMPHIGNKQRAKGAA